MFFYVPSISSLVAFQVTINQDIRQTLNDWSATYSASLSNWSNSKLGGDNKLTVYVVFMCIKEYFAQVELQEGEHLNLVFMEEMSDFHIINTCVKEIIRLNHRDRQVI